MVGTQKITNHRKGYCNQAGRRISPWLEWCLAIQYLKACMETLYRLTSSASFFEMVGTLLAEFVLTLTDAILFFHAWKYFSAELSDGTPFSCGGVDLMKHLGIALIVLPPVATIPVGVLRGTFNLTQTEAADVGNGTSVMMGIMLILVSVILRYGAGLEKKEKSV